MKTRRLCAGLPACGAVSCMLVAMAMPSAAAVLSFQQGVDHGYGPYAGATDTWINANDPDANYGSLNYLWVDYYEPGAQALLRFGDIFGVDPGRIPIGASITQATLRVYVLNEGTAYNPVRMLQPWDAGTLTWNNAQLGGNAVPGIQQDGIEAEAPVGGPGPFFHAVLVDTYFDIDVTALVQAWSDGAGNFGMLFPAFNDNGLGLGSSEHEVAAKRPSLVVDFVPEPGSLALLALASLVAVRRRSAS